MAPTRVLVVAGDPLARAGLAALLSEQPDVVLAGQASSADEIASAAAGADVVVWDLESRAPVDEDTLDHLAASRIPVLAVLVDPAQAADALGAGARGLVFRSTGGDALATAARAVASGLTVFDEGLRGTPLRPASGEALIEPLTARETEVLQLLAQGLSNKEIARRLAISDHTAKFHVNAILGKLGAQSRTEAIVQAARRGLVIL